MPKPIRISASRFIDFMVSDTMGKLAKVREIQQQYEQPYAPGSDFYSRFREGIVQIHRDGGTRADLAALHEDAKDNRAKPYRSACEGYGKFWGRKQLKVSSQPKPVLWEAGRLQVRLNPDFILEIDGVPMVVELHLKESLPVNQRAANPFLGLLDRHFGNGAGGPTVGLLDVHRGKLFKQTSKVRDLEATMLMEAASFVTGWEELERRRRKVA